MIAFSSCKKEKDCECTSSSNMSGSQDVVTSVTIKDGECKEMNLTTTSGDYTQKMECKEK